MEYTIHPTKDWAVALFSKKAKDFPITEDVIEVMKQLNQEALAMWLAVDWEDEFVESYNLYRRNFKSTLNKNAISKFVSSNN